MTSSFFIATVLFIEWCSILLLRLSNKRYILNEAKLVPMHFYLERAQQAIDRAIQGKNHDQMNHGQMNHGQMNHGQMNHGQIGDDQLAQNAVGTPPGKWTAAQIREHLSLTYASTGRLLERCLKTGKSSATAPTFSKRMAVALVLGLGHLPSGAEAPSFTRPKDMPPDSVLDTARRNLAAMDQIIARCEARFGTRLKIADHPILGPLTLPQWRKFHWIHTRHHARQIRRLRKMTSVQK